MPGNTRNLSAQGPRSTYRLLGFGKMLFFLNIFGLPVDNLLIETQKPHGNISRGYPEQNLRPSAITQNLRKAFKIEASAFPLRRYIVLVAAARTGVVIIFPAVTVYQESRAIFEIVRTGARSQIDQIILYWQ